jgi:hypothetical protein
MSTDDFEIARIHFRESAKKFLAIEPSRAKRIAEMDDACGVVKRGLRNRIGQLLDVQILKHLRKTINQCVPLIAKAHGITKLSAENVCEGGANYYRGIDAAAKADAQFRSMSENEKRKRFEHLTR